jgi:hypothetical protein
MMDILGPKRVTPKFTQINVLFDTYLSTGLCEDR